MYANDMNVGDYLSARGIIDILGAVDLSVAFERHRPLARRVLGSLGPGDLVIVGGGGLMKSTFDPFWQFFAAMASERGFSYVLWGVGYCDVKGEETRGEPALLRNIMDRAILAGLRDPMSLEPFDDLAQCELVACPSIALVQAINPPPGKARDIVLRVDHPDLLAKLVQPRDSAPLERLNHVVHAVGGELGLPVMVTDNLLAGSQRWVPDRLAPRVSPTRLARRTTERRAMDLVAQYQRASLVVTTRLHGAILGAAAGARIVALSADRKIDEFFGLLGLEQWVAEDESQLTAALGALHRYEHPTDALDVMVASNRDFAARVRTSWQQSSGA